MSTMKLRRVLSLMLIPAAAVPFLFFDKEVLLSIGSPLFWLMGYPLALALAFVIVAPPKGKSSFMGREHGGATVKSDDDGLVKPSTRLLDPRYSVLTTNAHYYDSLKNLK